MILFSPDSAFYLDKKKTGEYDPIYQYSVGEVKVFGIHPGNQNDFMKRI